MKRLALAAPLLSATLIAGVLLAAGSASAQEQPTTIVYVNTRALYEAHPQGQALIDLQNQATKELQGIADQIKPLTAKLQAGQQLTQDERNQLDLLQRTLQETQQRYEQDLAAKEKPISDQINAIIAQIAEENGYAMVLRGELLGTAGLGLVVWADPSLDITQQVIDRIKAQ